MKNKVITALLLAVTACFTGCATKEKDYEALRDKRQPLWEAKLTERNAEEIASLNPYDITNEEAAIYFVRAGIAEDQAAKVARLRQQKDRYTQAQVNLATEALHVKYGNTFGRPPQGD